MERKSWVPLLIFFIIISQLSHIQSQTIEKNIQIKWTDNVIQHFSEENVQEHLHFQDASYRQPFPSLPCYQELIPLAQAYRDYNVTIGQVQYEPMRAQDGTLIPASFTVRQPDVHVKTVHQRNKTYALLTFIPIIQTGQGQYSRITSISLRIEGQGVTAAKAAKTHPSQSVLAVGSWYSFTLQQDGIYQVTGQDLNALGMSLPISSSSIALFGNGGKMLPEANATARIEDLREIPIQIFDGGDGSLDKNDYFLFYGESPHGWAYDTLTGYFSHALNIYSDSTRYFITSTAGVGEKKRVATVDNSSLTATATVSEYTHYDFREDDLFNPWESGKEWFGDRFEATLNRSYSFAIPGYKSGSSCRVSVAAAASSVSHSQLTVSTNGSGIGSLSFGPIGNRIATRSRQDFSCTPSGNNLSIVLDYNQPTSSSSAYLDWIEIQVPCLLTMHSSQFPFTNPSTIGHGNVTRFVISGATSGTRVWDVTNPGQAFQHTLTLNGGSASFNSPTETLRKFIAFSGTDYLHITPGGRVENQNLHGSSDIDLVIIAHPDFISQAHRLANYRRINQGLKVKVVPIQQVYNEFSGGTQDPIAIRDYMKTIYDNSNKEYPKYLLLFGRPSYDFRGRSNDTKIFVPNYQYAANPNYISEYDFYSNDDNFGLLDEDEGCGSGLFDIAIGRFPASTQAQATAAVDKSIRYTESLDLVTGSSNQISNLADWRNIIAFVADDEDFNDFITSADNMSNILKTANPNINFDKIYLDAYQQISNAGGQRYPEVSTAINNRMSRGSLLFTYIGHSGKDGWSHERILEASDINKWSNKFNMPLMLSLSCTFAYYDRPVLSPAEMVLFNSNGGGAAIIAATREAWSSPNNSFGRHIASLLFSQDAQGRYPTIGDIVFQAKNAYSGAGTALAMFVLLGDPSMPLAIPTYRIVTDSINHHVPGITSDTLRALSKVTVSGHIAGADNQILQDFNGTLYPTIFDKKSIVTTLANDPNSLPFDFEVQKNILFKGNSTIRNGRFTFSFYIPKDIDYTFGNGKISYYAKSDRQDGAGAFSDFIIGGNDTNALNDTKGPAINLYLNNESFINGGMVDPSPTLIAKIRDDYGINTTGNGIGHDITAILDNQNDKTIILNDYYETEKDSFNSGTVRYPLDDLSVGTHTLRVRAWDINNNHAESEISFEVVSNEKLTLKHVLNYPNPFTTHTEFFFEQNQRGGTFDIQIQIYTISGKLLKTITETQFIEGNRSAGIIWDGRDDYGDRIGKGVYLYRLRVRNQNQETAEEIEKIVIL